MKLNFTLEELQEGVSVRRLGAKQLDSITEALRLAMPVRVRPCPVNGRYLYTVILTSIKRAGAGHEIHFTPLWSRTFIVTEARSNQLKLLVIETDRGQMQFDSYTAVPSRHRLSGPGVGEKAAEDAEQALARLLETDASSPILRSAMRHPWMLGHAK